MLAALTIFACTCQPPGGYWVSPEDGAENVPRDAQFAIANQWGQLFEVSNPTPIATATQTLSDDFGTITLLRPLEPLEADTRYKLLGYDERELARVRTGDGFSTGAPRPHLLELDAVAKWPDSLCHNYGDVLVGHVIEGRASYLEVGYSINGEVRPTVRVGPSFDGNLAGSCGLFGPGDFEDGDVWCVRMRAIGLDGAASDPTPVACAVMDGCDEPTDEELAAGERVCHRGGCRAAGGPGSAAAALLIALAMLGFRRR